MGERKQDFIPNAMKVIDANLLPMSFNSMKVLEKDPGNARPSKIRFYRGDSNNGGVAVMEMVITYDVDGDFESAYTTKLT